MNAEHFTDEQVLAKLGHRPRYIINGVISLDETAKPEFKIFDADRPSTLGCLEALPLEVIHMILNYLDLRALSRISSVSSRGRAVVGSLPAFKNLLSSAGHIFKIMSQTKVIELFSASQLNAVLHSDRCASCGSYGAFLFLLSAERCCYACMWRNQAFWMITRNMAQDMFVLSKRDVKALPVMRSVPGKYFVYHMISRKRQQILTSVKAAKALALEVHGSLDAMSEAFSAKLSSLLQDPRAAAQSQNYKWFQEAPSQKLPQYCLRDVDKGNVSSDRFCGMGSIPFPSLSSNGVENGIWCRGCELTCRRYHSLDRSTLAHLVPAGWDWSPERFLQDWQHRASSTTEFLEHARHCRSAAEVISKSWKGLF